MKKSVFILVLSMLLAVFVAPVTYAEATTSVDNGNPGKSHEYTPVRPNPSRTDDDWAKTNKKWPEDTFVTQPNPRPSVAEPLIKMFGVTGAELEALYDENFESESGKEFFSYLFPFPFPNATTSANANYQITSIHTAFDIEQFASSFGWIGTKKYFLYFTDKATEYTFAKSDNIDEWRIDIWRSIDTEEDGHLVLRRGYYQPGFKAYKVKFRGQFPYASFLLAGKLMEQLNNDSIHDPFTGRKYEPTLRTYTPSGTPNTSGYSTPDIDEIDPFMDNKMTIDDGAISYNDSQLQLDVPEPVNDEPPYYDDHITPENSSFLDSLVSFMESFSA